MAQSQSMNTLLEIGFVRAGRWLQVEGRLVLELARFRTQKNICMPSSVTETFSMWGKRCNNWPCA